MKHRTLPAAPHIFWLILSILLIMLVSACGAGGSGTGQDPTATAAPQPAATATLSYDPQQAIYWEQWREGPHANTYALEKGPNTYCARCHSPANWDPSATVGTAPNCVSCKFPFEAEPRLAPENPLVPQEKWANISCDICHKMDGVAADPEVAWHDFTSTYHETVPDSTALCEMCHHDTEVLRHHRELGTAAHADFECTECHEPHSTIARCSACHEVEMIYSPKFIPEHETVQANSECQECHQGAWNAHSMHIQQSANDDCFHCHGPLMGKSSTAPVQFGHSNLHLNVQCVACHDAGGLQVGPVEGQAIWMTFRTTEFLGSSSTEPYQSHALTGEVDCARCHYRNNPWDLATEDEWKEAYNGG